ncbi:MAG: hypothetical protein KGI54_06580 [Pseudomonadota bacterium]|nr:hypothetical protein [Pseudomonadota bacterium]
MEEIKQYFHPTDWERLVEAAALSRMEIPNFIRLAVHLFSSHVLVNSKNTLEEFHHG